MKVNLPQQIDKKQWLTRLGYSEEADHRPLSPEDARLLQQMEAAEAKLMQAAAPQGIYRFAELGSGMLNLPGNAIKKHLAECNGMVIMAVTLGAGIDRLIRTAQIRDMAEAVLLDSGASILAEQCADILEAYIQSETAEASGMCGTAADGAQGMHFTGRYSPGYGDFPIEMQGRLLKEVDGPKTIGLTVNESHILIPRKSITAIIGTADHPVKGYLATCDECLIKESCGLRKEGKQCWT